MRVVELVAGVDGWYAKCKQGPAHGNYYSKRLCAKQPAETIAEVVVALFRV